MADGDAPLDPSGFPDPGRPRFCARCGSPMEEGDVGGRRRPVCPRCGWVYYAKNAVGAGLLIEHGGRVLLVQRAHDPYQGQWMLPAGFVEYGEDAAATAVREAEEECALRVRLTGTFGIYFGRDDPRNPSYFVVYRATPDPPGQTPRAGDDAAATGWFPPDGLPPRIAFEGHRQALADWVAASGGPERVRPESPQAPPGGP
jgi:8-oxo-dGTP diphosphatase